MTGNESYLFCFILLITFFILFFLTIAFHVYFSFKIPFKIITLSTEITRKQVILPDYYLWKSLLPLPYWLDWFLVMYMEHDTVVHLSPVLMLLKKRFMSIIPEYDRASVKSSVITKSKCA